MSKQRSVFQTGILYFENFLAFGQDRIQELFTLTQILINYIITNINKGNELLKSEKA